MSPSHIPTAVRVAVLRAAAAAAHPRTALPTIASNHQLTLDQVKAIVEKHGWPRPDSMRRAAGLLEERERERAAIQDDVDGDDEVLVQVPLSKLETDPQNPRENLGDLTELADSLIQVGLVQPVVARRAGDKLILVSGHRRTAAARQLGWDSVKCVIRSTMDPDEVLAAMLAENGQRAALDPLEEAKALARLKERDDLSDMQLAKRVSRSQGWVSGRLALLGLSAEQQAEVRAGLMPLHEGTRSGRKQSGQFRAGAQGKKSAAHLTGHHPLADLVRGLCKRLGHHKNTPGRVGGVGCGNCWEDIIRADERSKAQAATA